MHTINSDSAEETMWKISVCNDALLPGMPFFERSLALLSGLGIEYIEPRLIDNKHILNMSNDEIHELKKTLKKYNMKVGGLGTPVFKCPLRGYDEPEWAKGKTHGYEKGNHKGDGAYEDHLKLLERAFEISDMLDALSIRCFSFWREYAMDEVFDEVVEKIQKGVRMARSSGHILAIENDSSQMAGTGVEMARIIRAVGEGLTGIYDFGNSWHGGGIVYPDDFEALKGGLLSHIHIKHESMENETTGERTIVPITVKRNYYHPDFLNALHKDGYKGLIGVDSIFPASNAEESIKTAIGDLKKFIKEMEEQ